MKITSAEFVLSGTKTNHFPTDNLPEVLFCGRSNVGKSSFINALVNRKALARTSSNPGKTQIYVRLFCLLITVMNQRKMMF